MKKQIIAVFCFAVFIYFLPIILPSLVGSDIKPINKDIHFDFYENKGTVILYMRTAESTPTSIISSTLIKTGPKMQIYIDGSLPIYPSEGAAFGKIDLGKLNIGDYSLSFKYGSQRDDYLLTIQEDVISIETETHSFTWSFGTHWQRPIPKPDYHFDPIS